MQKLHLVGFTTDHEALIFSARKGARSGGFVVPLDVALVATINDIIRLRDGTTAETIVTPGPNRSRRRAAPESGLTPREIQARIRAGKTIADVAGEAGVDEEWVERFAVPIIAEQQRVVDRVRGVQYGKPRLGLSSQPLGVAVAWNLLDKGVTLGDEEFERAWSAFQQRDGSWTVRFADELVARNRLASELAYVEPGRRRRRRRVAGESVEAPASPARKASRRKKAAAGKKATARKKAAPRARAAAARTPVRKAAAKKKAVAKKPAAKKKAAARKAPAKKKAAARKAAPSAPARRPTVAVRRTAAGSGSRRPRPLRAR